MILMIGGLMTLEHPVILQRWQVVSPWIVIRPHLHAGYDHSQKRYYLQTCLNNPIRPLVKVESGF